MAIRFPKLGSIISRRVSVHGPEGAEEFAFDIGVKLVGAVRAREWSHRFRKNQIAELKRVNERRKSTTVEESPELWEGVTDEGEEDGRSLAREILREALDSVEGVEAEDLIHEVEHLGLSHHILPVVISAQTPRPDQLLSSGS